MLPTLSGTRSLSRVLAAMLRCAALGPCLSLHNEMCHAYALCFVNIMLTLLNTVSAPAAIVQMHHTV